MTALADLVPSLKRFVAVPGEFASLFPSTTDADLLGALADGFSEARMRGLLSTTTLDLSLNTVSPDLEAGAGSLIVLFTGVQILRNEIRNRKSHTRYKAGAVESEVDYASSVLTELLRQYETEKATIVTAASTYGASDAFWMSDMAVARAVAYGEVPLDYQPYGGL